MLALVQCYFLQKTGKKLTYNELFKYIKNNCLDLNECGYDKNSGYGLFILPEMGDNMKIKLQIGNKLAYINDNEILLDTEPLIHNNRTLVPIRFIAEAFGCDVEWDNKERQVIIKK